MYISTCQQQELQEKHQIAHIYVLLYILLSYEAGISAQWNLPVGSASQCMPDHKNACCRCIECFLNSGSRPASKPIWFIEPPYIDHRELYKHSWCTYKPLIGVILIPARIERHIHSSLWINVSSDGATDWGTGLRDMLPTAWKLICL